MPEGRLARPLVARKGGAVGFAPLERVAPKLCGASGLPTGAAPHSWAMCAYCFRRVRITRAGVIQRHNVAGPHQRPGRRKT